MKATLNSRVLTDRYSFKVNHNGVVYDVVIFLNEKGKFIDEEVYLNDEPLEGEGTEGDIREAITDYLSNNWDSLVK